MPAKTIAYTSALANPIAAQADKVIDLSGGGALGVNVGLFGGAVDPNDNTATFTWAWSIVDKPSGSALAAIGGANVQNPTFGPVDIWGNYRFKLVATSNKAGGASESDVTLAPDTAFVEIRVLSGQVVVEKPAIFSRNWQDSVRKYATALENLFTKIINLELVNLADIFVATGAWVDKLCSGSWAEKNNGDPLHKHHGSAISVATQAAFGVVKLSVAPLDPLNPVIPSGLQVCLSASVDGTPTNAGYVPGKVVAPVVVVGNYRPVALWYLPWGVTIDAFSAAFADAGTVAGGGYTLRLLFGSEADWEAGTPGLVAAGNVTVPAPAADNKTKAAAITPAVAVAGPTWLGVCVTADPGVAAAGGGLTLNVLATRSL